MATAIINLDSYRQGRARQRQHETAFIPAEDRLWEYLTRNLKIDLVEGVKTK